MGPSVILYILIVTAVLLVTESGDVKKCKPLTDASGAQLTIVRGDGEEKNEKELENGVTITITCLNKYEFVNGVRRTTGVDTWSIDQGKGITMTCVVNTEETAYTWSPAVHKNSLNKDRFLWCDAGCRLYRTDKYAVTYPTSIVTSEENSPPIQYNNFMSVTLACQPGYTRSAGNVGKTSVMCKRYSDTNAIAWSTPDDQIIDCVSGCTDISGSVVNGETTDYPRTVANYPPYQAGDTVSFSCIPGYTLVGYAKLTCTSILEWSEKLPTCVYVTVI